MAAGDYLERVRRHVRLTTTGPTGQRVETFTPGTSYWANVEETAGRRQQNYRATQTGADGVIRIRNYPELKAGDRLVNRGLTWTVLYIAYGDNELICEVKRYDVHTMDDL